MQGQASGSRASLPLHFVASQMPYFWGPGSVCFTMLVPGSWYLLLVFLGAVHLPLSLWSPLYDSQGSGRSQPGHGDSRIAFESAFFPAGFVL